VNQVNPQTSSNERLLRLPDVIKQVSFGKSQIYASVKLGTFPAPVKLSIRAVAWPESQIQHWIAQRIKSGAGGAV
jgi:prophage regulatory protein